MTQHRGALEVRVVLPGDPAASVVIAGLAAEYAARYGPNDVLDDAEPSAFKPPDGAFVVVLDAAGKTLAGAGLRRLTIDTAEVKRMWTSPAHRRRGLARLVLTELERVAVERGYARVRLETGPAQPEAISFYRRAGYRDIPLYGRYEEALAFERVLRDG
jgi:ribosomal protein S18 acetylase RimI-like enzyme